MEPTTGDAVRDVDAEGDPSPSAATPEQPTTPLAGPAGPAVSPEPLAPTSADPAGSVHPQARAAEPGLLPSEPFPSSTGGVTPARFTLHRSRTDRMLGGVCGGLAESLGVDATLLRIALVVLTFLGVGLGAVFYVAVWIMAPQR